MTNRYRSSCCCSETENQSVCFTGFGAVPKTAYLPDGCHASDTRPPGNFNRHDNWSFCVHDKEEELVCVVERTGFKSFAELAYGGENNICDCDCLIDLETRAGIDYESLSRPPIVVWYKHPYATGLASDIPGAYIDELYQWRSYWREDARITPKYFRNDTWPCGCPDHIYSSAVGCRSDSFCNQDFFSYCGYAEHPNVTDPFQLVWWRDASGNLRYLTQSEMQFIGQPDKSGTDAGWRTSKWGYVPGGPDRDGDSCVTTDDGVRLGFGLLEGNPYREQKNGDYLYLQDILHQGNPESTNGKPILFKNYQLEETATEIKIQPEFGWGNCNEYPYGLWPLSFTFWGVMHREKWWQQYWNSISKNDVCPAGDCEVGVETDIYSSPFAERCRVPQYIIEQCAGVPIFTHELVDKLNTEEVIQELGALPNINTINSIGDLIELEPDSPAAYVMGAIKWQNGIAPQVTRVMEREGILPPPINYGEEQDYRIFKKTFKGHNIQGSDGTANEVGRCCINPNSGQWEGPLYCDCAVNGAEACGFTGTQEEANSQSITTCWDDQYFSDIDENGIADGIDCARFICGEHQGQSYEDFLAQLVSEGIYGSIDNARQSLIGCCDTSWDRECVLSARVATQYGYCGPRSLCVDTNKNFCRSFFGGQHIASDITCLESSQDPNVQTCADRYDQIGSCCIIQGLGGDGGGVGGGGGAPDPVVIHCLEISEELCNSFPTSLDAQEWNDWISSIPEGTVGGVSEEQLNKLWQPSHDPDNGTYSCRTFAGNECVAQYTGLRNCEPVCDTDDNNELNRNAFICSEDLEYIPCDSNQSDTYPCDNIGFDEFEYYFYGRPGGWRHICSGSIGMLPGEGSNDPDTLDVDNNYWTAFFPQSGSEYNGPDNCPQDGCWTAAPYPTDYSADPVPTGTDQCPQRQSNGDCLFLPSSGGPNCGEPTLTVCGSGIDGTPSYPDPDDIATIFWPGPDANYQSVNPYCYDEAYSHTCFGAWFQHKRTSFKWIGTDNGSCARNIDYFCSNINNAFWLRVPGKTRDDSFCRNYDIKYDLHQSDDPGGGGSDDSEWNGVAGIPAVLVYHNRVLDDFIEFYGGCVHEITQGTQGANLTELVTCSTTTPIIMQWDIFTGDPAGGYSLYTGQAGTDKVWIERNDGNPASSSNPYKITVHVEDGIGNDPPPLWWGIVQYDPTNIGTLTPIREVINTSGCSVSNPFSLFPSTEEQNKIYVKTKDQNPGDYPNGLRDYSWYHSPITREQPLPSAYFIVEDANPESRDCWTGTPCCGTRLTTKYGETICDHWKTDIVQGQPGGESECNYERLPSNGENLPDPMCGTCAPGTYCCPYLNQPRCIPDDTYCCSNCRPGQICVRNILGNLVCVQE